MCKPSTPTPPEPLPVRYVAIEEALQTPDLQGRRTFGIAAVRETLQGEETLDQVSDLTTDGAFASRLAEQCTRLGLSPIHLRDLAADLLNE